MKKILVVMILLIGCSPKLQDYRIDFKDGRSITLESAPAGSQDAGYFGGSPGQYRNDCYYYKDYSGRIISIPKDDVTVWRWDDKGWTKTY